VFNEFLRTVVLGYRRGAPSCVALGNASSTTYIEVGERGEGTETVTPLDTEYSSSSSTITNTTHKEFNCE